MGIENRRLEMLFVAPPMFGRGIGRRLVDTESKNTDWTV